MVRKSLAAYLLLALVLFTACRSDSAREARGLIVDVRAESVVEWESLTLRLSGGKELTFTRGADVDLRFWRASHLREHMAGAQPITVRYSESKGRLVAISISD